MDWESAYDKSEFLEKFNKLLQDEVVDICAVTLDAEPYDEVHNLLQEKIFKNWEKFLFSNETTNDGSSAEISQSSKMNKNTNYCGRLFKSKEVCFTCVDCAMDQTCVLCRPCFLKSEHVNHNYRAYHSTGNGYCDCGDVEAWKEYPRCRQHGGGADDNQLLGENKKPLYQSVLNPLEYMKQFSQQMEAETSEFPYFFNENTIKEENEYIVFLLKQISTTTLKRFWTLIDPLLKFIWQVFQCEVIKYNSFLEFPLPLNDDLLFSLPDFNNLHPSSMMNEDEDSHQQQKQQTECVLLLYNNEKHTFDQVEMVLTRFLRHTREVAVKIAMNVDRDGRCLIAKDNLTKCSELRNLVITKSLIPSGVFLKCEHWPSWFIAMQDFACHCLTWLSDLCERNDQLRAPLSIALLHLEPRLSMNYCDLLHNHQEILLHQKCFVDYFLTNHCRLWKNARSALTQFFMTVMCHNVLFRRLFSIRYGRLTPVIFRHYTDDDHTDSDNIENLSCQILTVISNVYYLLEQENICSVLLSYVLEELPNTNYVTVSHAALGRHNLSDFHNNSSPLRLNLQTTQEFTVGNQFYRKWHLGVRMLHCLHSLTFVMGCLPDCQMIGNKLSTTMWTNLQEFWEQLLRFITYGQDMISIRRELLQHVERDTEIWGGILFLTELDKVIELSFNCMISNRLQFITAMTSLFSHYSNEVVEFQEITYLSDNSMLTTAGAPGGSGGLKSDSKKIRLNFSHGYSIVKCTVSRDWVSIFQPLTHCLARACHSLSLLSIDLNSFLKIIDDDVNVACAHIIERPLRNFVLMAQTLAGMWVLNGYTIATMASTYHNRLMQYMYWDFVLIQQMACCMDPDHFVLLLLHKFELESYFRLPESSRKLPINLSKHRDVANRFFTLLYQLITHRRRVLVGQNITSVEEFHDILLHTLCCGYRGIKGTFAGVSKRNVSGMSHSEILSDLQFMGLVKEELLDLELKKVAIEKSGQTTTTTSSTSSSLGPQLFEARLELLSSAFTPYHITYLPKETTQAHSIVLRRLKENNLLSADVHCIPPAQPIALTEAYAALNGILHCSAFLNTICCFLKLVTRDPHGGSSWWNEATLEVVLYLIGTALWEDERQLNETGTTAPFLDRVLSDDEDKQDEELFKYLQQLSSMESLADVTSSLVRWTLMHWKRIANLRNQFKNQQISNAMEGVVVTTAASATVTPSSSSLLDQSSTEAAIASGLSATIDSTNAGEEERKSIELLNKSEQQDRKRKECEERKQRLLKTIAEKQRAFLSAANLGGGGIGGGGGSSDALFTAATSSMNKDNLTSSDKITKNMEMAMSDDYENIDKLKNTKEYSPRKSPTVHLCILCQSPSEEGSTDNPLCIIVSSERSSVLSLANHCPRKLNYDDSQQPVQSMDIAMDISTNAKDWRTHRIHEPILRPNNQGITIYSQYSYLTGRTLYQTWNPPEGTLLMSCGHIIHQQCIEKITDTRRRHGGGSCFQCSLCNRCGECLFILSPPSPNYLPGFYQTVLPPNTLDQQQIDKLIVNYNQITETKLDMNSWLKALHLWHDNFVLNEKHEISSICQPPILVHPLPKVFQIFYDSVLDKSCALTMKGELDSVKSPLPSALVYTLSLWERNLRSSNRTFFNGLAEYQNIFLSNLCRTTISAWEPIVSGLCDLSELTLAAKDVSLHCLLQFLLTDTKSNLFKEEDAIRNISIWNLDCISILVNFLCERDTQFYLLMNYLQPGDSDNDNEEDKLKKVNAKTRFITNLSNGIFNHTLVESLAFYSIKLTFTLHLLQIMTCAIASKEEKMVITTDEVYLQEENVTIKLNNLPFSTENCYKIFLHLRGRGDNNAKDILDSPIALSNYICKASLPYLRTVAFVVSVVLESTPPTELTIENASISPSEEVKLLLNYLQLNDSLNSYFENCDEEMKKLLTLWQNHVNPHNLPSLSNTAATTTTRCFVPSFPSKIPHLLDLPNDYTDLLGLMSQFQCPSNNGNILFCLICGQLICARGACCVPSLANITSSTSAFNRLFLGGEVHAREYHNGYCPMMDVLSSLICIFIPGQMRLSPVVVRVPYRDKYGEQIREERIAGHLYLNQKDYSDIQRRWLTHQFILDAKRNNRNNDSFPFLEAD